jgi:geranylgeranylglycerol-phosphate geranylgeranyltransferase
LLKKGESNASGGLRAYARLARPFTLLAPALGMVSGGVMGWGAGGSRTAMEAAGSAMAGTGTAPAHGAVPFPVLNVVLGALLAMALNAGSNAFNQIFDLEVDRINRPARPLPSGRLTVAGAGLFAAVSYALALILAGLVNRQCLAIVAAGAAFTMIYSMPPIRTKRYWPLANLTIAVPRGVLLVAAGWSTAADVRRFEPWFVSLVFGGFLLGAASTKDFADVEGDRAGGCRTLPVVYGARRAAAMVSPFLVVPFLLLPLGVQAGWLTGNPVVLTWLGPFLACWGVYVAYVMLRNPDNLTSTRNHASWKHMYLMMTSAQVGLIVAYLL